jgi:aryl-phospho-beta-D-glucosidase BglC (GH1 family)
MRTLSSPSAYASTCRVPSTVNGIEVRLGRSCLYLFFPRTATLSNVSLSILILVVRGQSNPGLKGLLSNHWNTFITENDFAEIKNAGYI